MTTNLRPDPLAFLAEELDDLRNRHLYRPLRVMSSAQGPIVSVDERRLISLSSNDYLGLTHHPRLRDAALRAVEDFGAGSGAVRTIAGTMTLHEDLERDLAAFKGTEATLTFQSGFTANTGVIPTITGEQDLIVSDELNHASIIDGMRLSKAPRKVYPHADVDALRAILDEAVEHGREGTGLPYRLILVVTDGVFSMEGDIARLPEIVELSREHDAIVIVDDSHGTGVMGATGRGVAEHFGLLGEIDVVTSTLGKALGGAAGGFVASSREVCDLLAQRSRPQLFSNAIPPSIACGALAAVRVLRSQPALVDRLQANTVTFRKRLAEAGFQPLDGDAAIIPIIVGETSFAIELSKRLLDEGVFVTGFGYPVVPEGKARVRVQMSAALEPEHLDRSLAAFDTVGTATGLLVA